MELDLLSTGAPRPFLPLFKADEATQTVWARAAAEEPDKAREIMDYVSAVPQFEKWSNGFKDATLGKSLGNIRAMHNPRHLAGRVNEIVYNDDTKSIDVCVKVLDPVDWVKVQEGGYTGLSIGGGYLRKWKDGDLTRYTPIISEISLVDAPCIPSARILELQKRDGTVREVPLIGHVPTFAEMLPPPSFHEALQKASRRDLNKIGFHPLTAIKEGVIADVTGGGNAGYGFWHGLLANRPKPAPASPAEPAQPAKKPGKSPSLKMPNYMRKQAELQKASWEEALANEGRNTASGVRYAGSYAHPRGKLFTGQNEAEPVRPSTGYRAGKFGAKPVEAEQPEGKRITVGSRGKAFTSYSGDDGFEKRAPDGLGKAQQDPAQRAKVAQVMHEWGQGKLRSWRGKNPRTGKPRRGPRVTDQKQAVAIALSQARRMGKREDAADARLLKSTAHPGFAAVQARIAREQGVSKDRAGAILAAGRRKASAAAVRKNPRLKRIKKIEDALAAAIEARLQKNVGDDQQRAISNAIATIMVARGNGNAVPGAADVSRDRQRGETDPRSRIAETPEEHVAREQVDERPGSRFGLNMPLYMRKGAAEQFLDQLNPPLEKSVLLPAAGALGGMLAAGKAFRRAAAPAASRIATEGLETASRKAAQGDALGAIRATAAHRRQLYALGGGAVAADLAGGIAGWKGVRALQNRGKPSDDRLRMPTHMRKREPEGGATSALTDKEHAQRIAAAKARWLKEGHHDADAFYNERAKQAGKSLLGTKAKVAAVEQQRQNFWHAVADTQDAYDKVRKHLHKDANLMMEVPHQAGLLYNPEGVGEDHFDESGMPTRDVYLLHPAEADDWIKQNGKPAGKGRDAVQKSAPAGLIDNLRELVPAAASLAAHADGRFAALPQDDVAA